MTRHSGNPVADNQHSIPAGARGPLWTRDYQLPEKSAHKNREGMPERPIHAEGSAAYGALTITHEIVQRPRRTAVKSKCLVVSS